MANKKFELKLRREVLKVKNYEMASCIARRLSAQYKMDFVIFTVNDKVVIEVSIPESKLQEKPSWMFFIRSEARYHKMVLAPYFK
jgi:hypothetical protein